MQQSTQMNTVIEYGKRQLNELSQEHDVLISECLKCLHLVVQTLLTNSCSILLYLNVVDKDLNYKCQL